MQPVAGRMLDTLLWIVVCMVSLRTAAMAFNRLVDTDIDRINPRTATRALPAGLLSKRFRCGIYRPVACGVSSVQPRC